MKPMFQIGNDATFDRLARQIGHKITSDASPWKSMPTTLILSDAYSENEAKAALFLHRHHPKAFRKFPTFSDPSVDPFYDYHGKERASLASGIMQSHWPWNTHHMDIRATLFGMEAKPDFLGNGGILPAAAGLMISGLGYMEHLALLWMLTIDSQVSISPSMSLDNLHIAIKGSKGHTFSVDIRIANPYLKGNKMFADVLARRGPIIFATPVTPNALDMHVDHIGEDAINVFEGDGFLIVKLHPKAGNREKLTPEERKACNNSVTSFAPIAA
ncbi:hypothetical protein HER14_19410 [Acidithiobacillus thiooxidans]|uniref:hypothetical protein n=1 Tax=Acidithiobacillus thiooxidans TaxID=930 RepID=UPI001C064F2E|nr:hypothetical protein [Acidithiobacillus thiooxidans]MBU2753034.1 hypothetical protein [Acidithiobacillus thiooxidans]